MRARLRSLLGLLLPFASIPAAAEPADVPALLRREIIGGQRTLAEVQDFCEARVPAMPAVASAAEWDPLAARLRRDVLDRVVFRGAAAAWREGETRVEWLDAIEGGPGYRIRKLRYQALPGLWIPALLYEPETLSGKVPAILNVNGHELEGKAAKNKQVRCINQAKRGMLALNLEWVGMGQLHTDNFYHYRMNQLDLCGTSGLAPYVLAMTRGLDVLLSHEHADPARVAVTGHSGGGWQTTFISALDTRVTLSNPVAGHSSFRTRARHLSDLGDSEQTPCDLATVADYAHLTAMVAPRPLLLTFNAKDDCCFRADHALQPLLDAARPIFQAYGKEDRLRWHVNEDPGTHNYERDNREAFYGMLKDHFYAGDAAFDPKEIPCDAEVKTAEQLRVELPKDGADFHTLALALSRDLPRAADLPAEKAAAEAWQKARRENLRALVRAHPYAAQVERVVEEEHEGLKAKLWRLRVGEAWTVPVVELSRGRPEATALVVADPGRAGASAAVARELNAGRRVLAVDPFYFGESKIASHDFLFALLVSAVGERPLGVQASQVAAVARWAKAEQGLGPATLVAVGPRAGVICLVAAALEESAVGGVELHDSFGSLKEVIERNGTVEQTPELFCFGLLEAFDIKQIAALAAPRPVTFVKPGDRVKAECAGLEAWYGAFGTSFQPLH